MKSKPLYLTLAAFALWAILSVASHFAPVPPQLLFTTRWIALALFVLYGFYKRKLTAWILVAMAIGAAIGHDWPHVAVNLRVIAAIFLRLIKTIIAPLLFATLVSGIAAHSDLKKVGRLGLKAIIYFELVTTVALFIGLGAINLTKVGVGVKLPPVTATETIAPVRPGAAEVILHVFPENIASAVAE